jgi:putative spermidine/putrescine transport system substrate-binding protein
MTWSCRVLALTASAIALLGTAAPPADAESAPQELVLACFGGHVQQDFQQVVLPSFEKQYNVKVRYVPGVSTSISAQLAAEKDNPQVDVACMDDGPQSRARGLGLLQPSDPAVMTNLPQTYEVARLPDGIGVGWGLLAAGLVYNADALRKANIAPPESWNDLASPRFKDHVVIPSITTTPGLYLLVMLARSNGGDMANMGPGFAKSAEVSTNAVGFDTLADPSKFFQQGEAWIGVWTNAETNSFVKKSGFPLSFVYPSDGAPAIMPTASTVKGAPHPKLADELLNYLISEEVQTSIATELVLGPVNTKVKVPEDLAKRETYGPDAVSKLVRMDWAAINPLRAAWTDRWNREVER